MQRIRELVNELNREYLSFMGATDRSGTRILVNDLIFPDQYEEYRKNRNLIQRDFHSVFASRRIAIEAAVKELNRLQPALQGLTVEGANSGSEMPSSLVMGRAEVHYGDKTLEIPYGLQLPVPQPMYLLAQDDAEALQRLLLRAIFAFPFSKCEVTVFDPENYGSVLEGFNVLLRVEELFPQKKILSDEDEFREVLEKVDQYAQNLLQEEFPSYPNCRNWQDYNRIMLARGMNKKVLSYKILCFFGIGSENLRNDCFALFQKLAKLGPKVGIMPIFIFDKADIEPNEYGKLDRQAEKLLNLVNISADLRQVAASWCEQLRQEGLKVVEKQDLLPTGDDLYDLMVAYRGFVEDNRTPSVHFRDLLREENCYIRDDVDERTTVDGLFIPMGTATKNGDIVELRLGDPAKEAAPHALLGGATGSGKSNLLHMIINSACWHYSPEELALYLLDFKDGVEFNAYANPCVLPHAKLIATQADPEYGVTILEHLVDEKERRNDLFKSCGVKDFSEYRKQNPYEELPRILLLVDEFQVLLDGTNGQKAMDNLLMLAKQGRAAGIHMLLATQSLKGLNFGTVEDQFGARIALKCSAADSGRLLGDYNNDEAVRLKIPFGILNASGVKSGNVKFAVPEAKPDYVAETVELLHNAWDEAGREFETKIFNGATLPAMPDISEFDAFESVELNVGVGLDYAAEAFKLVLKPTEENHVLICGKNEQMRDGMLKSIVRSAGSCSLIEETVYIGLDSDSLPHTYKKPKVYKTVAEFMKALAEQKEEAYDKSRIIIVDRRNIVKEINYTGSTLRDENAKLFDKLLKEGCHSNNFVIAFYEGYNRVKEVSLGYARHFGHKIALDMVAMDIIEIGGNAIRLNSNANTKARAAYIQDGILSWFRPYIERREE